MDNYFSPTGYLSSASLQTSVANAEIIPAVPVSWTLPTYVIRKMNIMNYSACTLIVNGQELFLTANLGFQIDTTDVPVTSLKIKESSITYTYFLEY